MLTEAKEELTESALLNETNPPPTKVKEAQTQPDILIWILYELNIEIAGCESQSGHPTYLRGEPSLLLLASLQNGH